MTGSGETPCRRIDRTCLSSRTKASTSFGDLRNALLHLLTATASQVDRSSQRATTGVEGALEEGGVDTPLDPTLLPTPPRHAGRRTTEGASGVHYCLVSRTRARTEKLPPLPQPHRPAEPTFFSPPPRPAREEG
jgi:hypothetical protein